MQNTINVLKNIKNGLKSLSLSLFLVFSVASSTEEYVPIPLDKLVCYGKGTQQQLSPSGEFWLQWSRLMKMYAISKMKLIRK